MQVFQIIARAVGLLLGDSGKPQTTRILIALIAGLAVGIAAAAWQAERAVTLIAYAQPVGTAWLNALRMTIVPLTVALLVTGIAQTAQAASGGKAAGRSIALFLIVLWTTSALSAALTLGFLDLWPAAPQAAAALRATVAGPAVAGQVPTFADFVTSLVPSNPIASAATDAFLPLTVFATVFAFAVTRLPEARRATLTGLFQALAEAMLVVINWVLWLAPIGVFALSYVVGAKAGNAAFGALLHYVAIVSAVGAVIWALAYPAAAILGRVGSGRFLAANAPVMAVAISTQSSLASLPAMLRASEKLGIPVSASGVVLPLAVALFRATGPCMNLAVAIYVAHVFGVQLGAGQLAAGIVVAAITTMGAVSLPGAVSYISSIAPIAVAMGVPIEPLAILVGVEMLPDLVRTLGNVTWDVTATAIVARSADAPRGEADALLEG